MRRRGFLGACLAAVAGDRVLSAAARAGGLTGPEVHNAPWPLDITIPLSKGPYLAIDGEVRGRVESVTIRGDGYVGHNLFDPVESVTIGDNLFDPGHIEISVYLFPGQYDSLMTVMKSGRTVPIIVALLKTGGVVDKVAITGFLDALSYGANGIKRVGIQLSGKQEYIS